ncbi:MAG: twin-arginine translocase TatA/TatE family subunit, partial [Solirubrobacteraceae bacterium]
MVGDILQPTHLLLVLVVALLVLGPKRLPEVARHLGTGIRDFRDAISGEQVDRTTDPTRQVTPDSPPAEALQTQAVVAEPEPVAAKPEPTVTEVIPEPETSQTDAVVAAPAHEPEPSPAQVVAEPEPEPSPAQVLAEPEPEANQTDPRPDHTEQAATAPLAAPEHPPE